MLLEGCINALQALTRAAARSPPCPAAPGRLALPTRKGLGSGLCHLRDHAELLEQAQHVCLFPVFHALAASEAGD